MEPDATAPVTQPRSLSTVSELYHFSGVEFVRCPAGHVYVIVVLAADDKDLLYAQNFWRRIWVRTTEKTFWSLHMFVGLSKHRSAHSRVPITQNRPRSTPSIGQAKLLAQATLCMRISSCWCFCLGGSAEAALSTRQCLGGSPSVDGARIRGQRLARALFWACSRVMNFGRLPERERGRDGQSENCLPMRFFKQFDACRRLQVFA